MLYYSQEKEQHLLCQFSGGSILYNDFESEAPVVGDWLECILHQASQRSTPKKPSTVCFVN